MGGISNTKNRRDPNSGNFTVPLEHSSPSSAQIKGSRLVTGRIVTAIEQQEMAIANDLFNVGPFCLCRTVTRQNKTNRSPLAFDNSVGR